MLANLIAMELRRAVVMEIDGGGKDCVFERDEGAFFPSHGQSICRYMPIVSTGIGYLLVFAKMSA